MQLLVVGATGGTGLQIIEQALQRGHFVTAFVRDPAKLPVKHPNLTVETGDVLKPQTLLHAVRRQDVVICALGSRPGQHDEAVADGTKNLIAAMRQAGVRRLLVVSSLGVGTSYEEASLPSKLVIKTLLSGVIAEKEKQEHAIHTSKLDWVIVRPTRLTNGPLTGKIRLGEHLPFPRFSIPKISRADVAAFLLDQLDNDQYLGKAVTITGK
ncbi:SDR family oxidoreductase [Spirosoma sp. KCTC 42546]|uniref:NAD(P)-dependent oxidoreductase n=1 Tax=Spirosoma sp. KCTC 42546 TaxID=2520506 RepID=UPI001159A6BF|nr:NAD(P)-binding oxidoreductase [Spirosoma sp. KCTC 42546]QDK79249.1 SDR family oxidoreductase [Spirosoma sp. KCTC 42546]